MKSICFANVKGGVGKSSLTLVAANVLADQGFSVCIVDCDIAQTTCKDAWELSSNPTYDVFTFNPGSDEKKWNQLVKDVSAYDYVFFDIPGSVFQDGVITLLSMMDKIIIVTKCSSKDLLSTKKFISDVLTSNKIVDFKVLLNILRPYRDIEHKNALEAIEVGESSEINELLGVGIDSFFKNHIMDEQAAIEKNVQVGEIHKKIMQRYEPFFVELVQFIEAEN